MSHNAIENTYIDMRMACYSMEKLVHEEHEINSYEQDKLELLVMLMKEFLSTYERGIAEGIINTRGELLNVVESEEE